MVYIWLRVNNMIAPSQTQSVNPIDFDTWSERLKQVMLEAVLDNTFSNRMLIKPRHLKEMVATESAATLQFIGGNHDIKPQERGSDLAQLGLGQDSIIAITASIRRTYHELQIDSPLDEVDVLEHVEDYCNQLTRGYMVGRVDEVLKEQERTREAYVRMLEKNGTYQ